MEGQQTHFDSIKDIPDSVWQKLSKKKIYFGHQSVGFNIIDGIRDVMKEHPEIKLNIVETANSSDFKIGLIAHSRVGKNVNPSSKIRAFVDFIDQGIGKKADAVALKFCYVDIQPETDVDGLLDEYGRSVAELENKYPGIKIIHFTDPLTVNKTNWKSWIKKIIGRKDPWGYIANIKRNEYNQKIVEKYEGRELIFDIATIESTYPDGKRCSFNVKGKSYYSMVPEYSTDGGHLNKVGRKIVAEQFLILLTKI